MTLGREDRAPPVLIDLRERQKGRHRLFFALYPDARAAQQARRLGEDLRKRHGLKGKPFLVERLHVTLLFLNDFVDEPAEMIAAAGEAVAAIKAKPFEVAFDHVLSFSRPNNRPLVLCSSEGLPELGVFRHTLGRALQKRFVMPLPAYTPHMTLLYDDRRVDKQAVEPVRWMAREFTLVMSLLGQSRHVPLAHWTLN